MHHLKQNLPPSFFLTSIDAIVIAKATTENIRSFDFIQMEL